MADASPFDDFDMPADDAPVEDAFGGVIEDAEDTIDGFFGDATPADDQPDAEPLAAPADDEDVFGAADTAEVKGQEVEEKDDVFGEAAVKSGVEEETALSIWEREHQEALRQKKEASREAKLKAQADAAAEIKEFYAKREETLKRTMENNRMEEKNMRQDLANLMENGTQWEKVARLVNLQPTQDDGNTGRLRKLLIQLKNDREMESKKRSA